MVILFFGRGFDEIKAGLGVADFERQSCVVAGEKAAVFRNP